MTNHARASQAERQTCYAALVNSRKIVLIVCALGAAAVAGWLLLVRCTAPTNSGASGTVPARARGSAATFITPTMSGSAHSPSAGSNVNSMATPPADGAATQPTTDAGPQVPARNGSNAADDVYPHGAVVTPRIMELHAAIKKLVKQCYEQVHAQRPNVRGRIALSVSVTHQTDVGNLIADAKIDKALTTITDAEFLQCAAENPFASEAVLELLKAEGDPSGGNMQFNLDLTFPLAPEPKPSWPADSDSPVCPAGTILKGNKPPKGENQWCELPNGDHDGEEYVWKDNQLIAILLNVKGRASNMRMRPIAEE